MNEGTSSSGMLYFYFRGTLEENNQVCIHVQDTYKCLPEAFYKCVHRDFVTEGNNENVV